MPWSFEHKHSSAFATYVRSPAVVDSIDAAAELMTEFAAINAMHGSICECKLCEVPAKPADTVLLPPPAGLINIHHALADIKERAPEVTESETIDPALDVSLGAACPGPTRGA